MVYYEIGQKMTDMIEFNGVLSNEYGNTTDK